MGSMSPNRQPNPTNATGVPGSQASGPEVSTRSVSTEVEQFILGELIVGRGIDSVDREENLLVRGIVDSHGLLQLVSFLEERFGITVADQDINPDNFESVAAIEAFVQRELSGQT
jgi:acyl carrier protein